MAHKKLYGVCEDKSLVETYSKDKIDELIAGADSNVEIVDNLTSTATDKALSANQGKVLNDKILASENILNNEINERINADNVINARIVTFTSLAEG